MPFIRRSFTVLSAILIVSVGFAQNQGGYKCLSFDGTDDYVQIQDDTSLNPTTAITIEAWINADSYGTNIYDNSIFCKHGWGRGNQGYVLRCGDNGKLSFNIADAGGTWREAQSSSLMSTGKWYHVAGSYDGDSVNIYLNGILVGTNRVSTTISASSGLTARIGDLAYGGGRRFDGMIDEVRVWSVAVDEENIRKYMCRKNLNNHPNLANLSGYWQLNETSGTSSADASNRGNTGTQNNGPTVQNSGAVIGDTSVVTIGSQDLTLKTSFGDEMQIQSISGSPSYFHLIADYAKSSQSVTSGSSIDTTHYFSVHYPEDTSVKFDVSYHFGNLKGLGSAGKCAIHLFKKSPGRTGTWSDSKADFSFSGDSLFLEDQKNSEFVAAFQVTDSNDVITSNTGKFYLCGDDKLTLTAAGSDSFTYTWYMNDSTLWGNTKRQLEVDSAADYRVSVSRGSSSCQYSSATITVKKTSKPSVTFTSLKAVCEDVDTIVLQGVTPSGGTFSGTGVSGGLFFPSQVKQGSYDITYTYSDTFNCVVDTTNTQVVNPLPQFNKIGGNTYCNNIDSIKLNEYTPTGGMYVGKYIVNGYIDLVASSYKTGFYAYAYELTDANGCYNSIADSTEVKWATPCTISVQDSACAQDDSIQLAGVPANGSFTGKGVNGDHFYPSIVGPGAYKVTYSFTNNLGCTSFASKEVKVIQNSTVTWSEHVVRCVNSDTVQLREGTPNGGSFDGPGLSKSGLFNSLQAGAGKHKLNYRFRDQNGCLNRASIEAIVHDTTAITFDQLSPFCLHADASLLSVASPANGKYSGPGISNDTLVPVSAGKGNHMLTYALSNSDGCLSLGTLPFEVLTPDSVSITASKVLMCETDDPVVIKTYPSGGKLTGKGIISNVFSPSISGVGDFTLTYRLTDTDGCPAFDTLVMSVASTPQVSLSGDFGICSNVSSFAANFGVPADSGMHKINGTVIDSIRPTELGPGSYMLSYVVENYAGCADSATNELRIHPSPLKPIISKVKNKLISSSPKGNQWLEGGIEIAGAIDQEFNPSKDGIYSVRITSDSGCVETSDTYDFMYVGVSELKEIGIIIYPNPSASGLYFVRTSAHVTQMEVLSVNGRRLQVTIENNIVDLRNQPPGVYVLTIVSEGISYAVKLMKH